MLDVASSGYDLGTRFLHLSLKGHRSPSCSGWEGFILVISLFVFICTLVFGILFLKIIRVLYFICMSQFSFCKHEFILTNLFLFHLISLDIIYLDKSVLKYWEKNYRKLLKLKRSFIKLFIFNPRNDEFNKVDKFISKTSVNTIVHSFAIADECRWLTRDK